MLAGWEDMLNCLQQMRHSFKKGKIILYLKSVELGVKNHKNSGFNLNSPPYLTHPNTQGHQVCTFFLLALCSVSCHLSNPTAVVLLQASISSFLDLVSLLLNLSASNIALLSPLQFTSTIRLL